MILTTVLVASCNLVSDMYLRLLLTTVAVQLLLSVVQLLTVLLLNVIHQQLHSVSFHLIVDVIMVITYCICVIYE